jgi:hypothetical protein
LRPRRPRRPGRTGLALLSRRPDRARLPLWARSAARYANGKRNCNRDTFHMHMHAPLHSDAPGQVVDFWTRRQDTRQGGPEPRAPRPLTASALSSTSLCKGKPSRPRELPRSRASACDPGFSGLASADFGFLHAARAGFFSRAAQGSAMLNAYDIWVIVQPFDCVFQAATGLRYSLRG